MLWYEICFSSSIVIEYGMGFTAYRVYESYMTFAFRTAATI